MAKKKRKILRNRKTSRNGAIWAKYNAFKKAQREEKNFKVYSKRGVQLKGVYTCVKCEKEVHNPMRYTDTSKGAVVLCAICTPYKNKWVGIVRGGLPSQGKK